jgi:hypothetical protein
LRVRLQKLGGLHLKLLEKSSLLTPVLEIDFRRRRGDESCDARSAENCFLIRMKYECVRRPTAKSEIRAPQNVHLGGGWKTKESGGSSEAAKIYLRTGRGADFLDI